MIRVHWWRGGGGHGNFGDVLAPHLCRWLTGRTIEHAPIHQADLIVTGSLLEPWFWRNGTNRHYGGFVWGAGRMSGRASFALPAAKFCAVRGPLTLERLDCVDSNTVVLGDPGLLAHLLSNPMRKRCQLGVIPHWTQRKDPRVTELVSRSADIRLINICDSVDEVIAQVQQCRYILSSSLHGLVLADSLRIPNLWLQLRSGREHRDGLPDFKYRDYYSLFNLENIKPLEIAPNESLDTLLPRFASYARPGLERIQRRLLDAFPYDELMMRGTTSA